MNPKARHILQQVRLLYFRYGIKSVTMDDAARHLGISKKTLYEHFRDKEDLVGAVLMNDHEQGCSVMDHIEKNNFNAVEELFEVYKILNEWYKEYNPSMVYYIRKYYPGLFAKIRKIRRERILTSSVANIEKGKQEGLYRKEIDTLLLAKLHVLRIECLFESDIFTLEEATSMTLMHELFVYHIYGILSHEGRLFFEENFDRFRATL